MKILICGVGALGSTAALFCRSMDVELAFVDFDRVETKNLSAQSFVKQSLGKNKATALKMQLWNFYGRKSEAHGVRLSADNIDVLCGGADLLVDCFDNAASRELLSGFARAHDVPLVHAAISANGDFGLVRWDERFVADAEDHEGQQTCEGGEHLPFIGVVAASLARVIQDFVSSQRRRDLIVNLEQVLSSR